MPTYNGETLTITLDSGLTQLDVVDDIYEPWKDWMLASPLNRRYPAAFRSDGGNPLSSIINQGSYIFLNNIAGWRIKPPEEDITIYLTGNLAVENTALPAFSPTTGAYTAAILGLQPVTQGVSQTLLDRLNYSAYEDGVTYDATNGDTAANYALDPDAVPGAVQYPLDNWTDVKAVADEQKFTKIFLNGSFVTGASDVLSDRHFYGDGATLNITRTLVTLTSGVTTTNSHYHDCKITGYQGGESNYHNCIIDGLENAHCYYDRCGLMDGTSRGWTIKQSSSVGSGHASYFKECYTDEGTAILDRNGAAMNVTFDGFHGRLKIVNQNRVTGSGQVWVHMNGGTLTVDASCTAGTVTVTGVGTLVNDSQGTEVDASGFTPEQFKIQTMHIESTRETHQGFGERFFCDWDNGNDDSPGTSPSSPLKTITAAVAKCVSGRGDVIFLIAPGAGAAIFDEHVVIDKEDVHIRGPGRGVEIKPTASGSPTISVTANNCSLAGFVARSATGSNDDVVVISGKFSESRKIYVVGSGQGVGTGNGIVFTHGDYHELHDCEAEKTGGAPLLIQDLSGGTGNGSPREISVKGGNYYLGGTDGIRFEGTANTGPGTSTRLCRVLGANIHDNLGYGVNIDALTSGTVISDGTMMHNNTLGNVNDLGLGTHDEAAINLAAHGTRVVEGAYTADEVLRIMAAALAGQRSGIGTVTETYTGLDGATPRVVLTPDQYGNGTPVLDGAT